MRSARLESGFPLNTDPSRSRGRLAAGLLALLFVVPLACGVNPQPTDYGQDYEDNFMLGCTGRFQDGDNAGEESSDAKVSAPEDECQCVYDGLVEKVPFSEAKEFEDQQAEADSGDEIEVPDNIQSIIDECGQPG
jgi:hypothetical protein